MRSSKAFCTAVAMTMISAAAALAAHFDFSDPKRALGREDDILINAELSHDTITQNSPINVTYQVENLTHSTVAVADKVTDMTFDPDSRTVILSVGAEVPTGPTMPHLVTINPGEKRVLTAGALVHIVVPNLRSPWTAVPRYVQIRVNVLRDITRFAKLIEQQSRTVVPAPLPSDLFDRWVESSDSVFLNAIPVYWKEGSHRGTAESNQLAGTY